MPSLLSREPLLRLTEPPARAPLDFHAKLPDYAPTPLLSLPALASELGIKAVLVKDESARLGLPSFKVLGASWAAYRAAEARLGQLPPRWAGVEELASALAPLRPLTLATATDGNHGRAVARVARWFGFEANIFVPRGTIARRIADIEAEGARVTVVDGVYDDAVRVAAASANERVVILADTGWEGYVTIPRAVIDGYSTLFWEIEAELARGELPRPDIVFVQMGVGSLGAAAALHFRRDGLPSPRLVGVEPTGAACVLESMRAGRQVTVVPRESVMAGLNCGTPSLAAWPYLAAYDAFIGIEDDWALDAVRALAACRIRAGATGAAGLAGLVALARGHDDAGRARPDLHSGTTALAILTEGVTDPDLHAAITSRPAALPG